MTRKPVTLVTGGGRGIGAAICLELAAAGHNLVLNYRTDDDAADDIHGKVTDLGSDCISIQADITSSTELTRLFTETVEHFGYLTGLVNNAGATFHIGPLTETPPDIIRRVIDVNLTSAILCAQQAVRLMTDGGAIVNISSVAAGLGAPGEYVHYAAAKAGIEAFTVGLAKEVGAQGIRVNAVSPGTVRTDIHADAGDPGRVDRVAAAVPLGRVADPSDIAPAVAFLFSPGAAYISGAIIKVSGGR